MARRPPGGNARAADRVHLTSGNDRRGKIAARFRARVSAMEPRTVDRILEEWRAAERELEAAPETARLAIQARIHELREEHRVAIEDRASVAMELSQAQL